MDSDYGKGSVILLALGGGALGYFAGKATERRHGGEAGRYRTAILGLCFGALLGEVTVGAWSR